MGFLVKSWFVSHLKTLLFCFCLAEPEPERWCCREKCQTGISVVFVSPHWTESLCSYLSLESVWWLFDLWGLCFMVTEEASLADLCERQMWCRGKCLRRNASSCPILSWESELLSPLIFVNLCHPENRPVTAFEDVAMSDVLRLVCWRRSRTITSLPC